MSTATTPHETQVNGSDLKVMAHGRDIETWTRRVLAREENVVGATIFTSSVKLHFDGAYGSLTPPEGYAIRRTRRTDELSHVTVDTARNADQRS